MSFDSKEFLADVLSKVADPAQKKVIEEALTVAEVTSALDAGFSRQADYSRNMDELKTARIAAEAEINQQRGALDTERTGLVSWYEDASKTLDTSNQKLAAYQDEYGELEGGGNTVGTVTAPGISREEYEVEMQKRDSGALFDHQRATGLPLDAAYKDFVSERVATANEEKHAEAVKQAREEGRIEGLSGHELPVQPDHASPARLAFDKPTTSEDRVGAAATKWREQFPGGSPAW